jgi:predicted DNA-binding helix-hairpin-helix protein
MNTFDKAKILGDSGKYDSCGPKTCQVDVEQGLGGIYYAKAENQTCKLFKTLMTNACSFDCKYCANSAGCKTKKATFEQEELAKFFNHLRQKVGVHGLFLSSGVAGDPDRMTEKMIETVQIIRGKYKFRGYIHFKVLPGTSYELVKQASEISSRMSINIEAPHKQALSELSSNKDFKIDILKRQAWISKMKLSGGQSTQMIINELSTDKEVLKMMNWEYNEMNLKRVYYSAFRPVKGTPLEDKKAESKTRETHIYNVDFLTRKYNYKTKEFNAIMDNGMLPREDPKLALAKQYFDKPIDINQASYDELIRIPGIGPSTAEKIVQGNKINKFEDLHKFGGWIEKAKPFIEVNGHRQKMLMEF